jgi:hypothetical protein
MRSAPLKAWLVVADARSFGERHGNAIEPQQSRSRANRRAAEESAIQ